MAYMSTQRVTLPVWESTSFKSTLLFVLSELIWLLLQASDGAEAEILNLGTKVPLEPSKQQAELALPNGEAEKTPLPGWSEKMAKGILSGVCESFNKVKKTPLK